MQDEKHVCTSDCKHCGSRKVVWFIVIALVILAGGYSLSRGGKQDVRRHNAPTNGSAGAAVRQEERKTESSTESQAQAGITTAGRYEPYDETKLARAKEGDVVLFFHAGWCPTCRALDRDLKERADAIPANLTILQVDYDTATELKKKYGVVMQSTFVQVDENGNLLKKWSESTTLNDLVAQVI